MEFVQKILNKILDKQSSKWYMCISNSIKIFSTWWWWFLYYCNSNLFMIEHIVLISANLKKKMKNRSRRYSSIDVTIIMDPKRNIHRKGTRCSLVIVRCDHRCSLALIFTPYFEKERQKHTNRNRMRWNYGKYACNYGGGCIK